METIMHIGAKVNKEDVNNLADGITKVFDSAHKNRISSENVTSALEVFARTFEVKNVTVTNSHFIGEDNKVTVNTAKEDKDDYTISGKTHY